MIWNWPQITMASLVAFEVLVFALLDGKPRTGNYSFAQKVCSAAIVVFLLYMGGFWAGARP